MKRFDERGSFNILVIPVIVLALLFIAATSFAIWAFSGRQDYKNNVDEKITAANTKVIEETKIAEQKVYAEEIQRPYVSYVGPDSFGGLNILHPKTWSVYVGSSLSTTASGLDVYMNPGNVPSVSDQSATYALRAKVLNQPYNTMTQRYAQDTKVTVSAYQAEKVPGVVGIKVEGQIEARKQGTMIILPLRDKTLQIWTESATHLETFNTVILPNLTFNP